MHCRHKFIMTAVAAVVLMAGTAPAGTASAGSTLVRARGAASQVVTEKVYIQLSGMG